MTSVIPSESFLSPIPQLACGICYEIPFAPRVTPCGHNFCDDCLEPCLGRLCCPICRKEFTYRYINSYPVNTLARNIIAASTIRCPNYNQGCTEKYVVGVDQRNHKNHLQKCPVTSASCLGCRAQFPINLIEGHVDLCATRYASCKTCQKTMKINLLDDHYPVCPKRMWTCPHCEAVMLMDKKNGHLTLDGSCESFVRCPHGCKEAATEHPLNTRLTRKRKYEEDQERKPLMIHTSDLCTHLQQCPNYPIWCSVCDVNIRREYFKEHITKLSKKIQDDHMNHFVQLAENKSAIEQPIYCLEWKVSLQSQLMCFPNKQKVSGPEFEFQKHRFRLYIHRLKSDQSKVHIALEMLSGTVPYRIHVDVTAIKYVFNFRFKLRSADLLFYHGSLGGPCCIGGDSLTSGTFNSVETLAFKFSVRDFNSNTEHWSVC